jgi:hypothetical protein
MRTDRNDESNSPISVTVRCELSKMVLQGEAQLKKLVLDTIEPCLQLICICLCGKHQFLPCVHKIYRYTKPNTAARKTKYKWKMVDTGSLHLSRDGCNAWERKTGCRSNSTH